MDYRHSADALENSPEAYEKLIADCLKGDSTNFSHWEEVAQSWHIVDLIRQTWDQEKTPIPLYDAGTMGPDCSFDLLQREGYHWVWTPDQWYKERGDL